MDNQRVDYITITEYARLHGISPQAVSQQIQRHADQLSGHVTTNGRRKYLDQFAADYLDQHRLINAVVIADQATVDRAHTLEEENSDLKSKVITLQEEILTVRSTVLQLETEKQKQLEDKAVAEAKIEELAQLQKEAEEKAAEISGALEAEKAARAADQEARAEEKAAADQELQELRKALEEQKAETDRIKNRGLLDRIFNRF